VQTGLTVGRRVIEPGASAPRPGYGLDEFVFLLGVTLVALLTLSALHRHRVRKDELEATAARLQAALFASTVGLAAERDRLAAHVRLLLEERLGPTSLRPALFTPARLRAITDDVLRPLSHQLSTGAQLPGARLERSAPRARLADVLRSLKATPVVRPRLLAATMVLLTFRFSITPVPERLDPGTEDSGVIIGDAVLTVDWASLIESFALHAATFLIVFVGARMLAGWLERLDARHALAAVDHSRPTRLGREWSLTIATLVVLGLTSLGLVRSVFAITGVGTLPPLAAESLAGFTAPLLLVTLVTSLLPATERALDATREQLAELNADLAAATARANALLEHERRLFARHLHASVQPAVNAASLMIERASWDGRIDPVVVADAAALIESSVEGLLDVGGSDASDTTGGAADLDARLAAILATWEGLAEVTIDLDGSVRVHLADDPVARATVCDVIAEACANAVIHGRAGRIDVTVRPEGDGRIDEPGDESTARTTLGGLTSLELRVADDGQAPATREGHRGPGLGSRILTSSCTRWELDHRDDGTVLTAVLPVR